MHIVVTDEWFDVCCMTHYMVYSEVYDQVIRQVGRFILVQVGNDIGIEEQEQIISVVFDSMKEITHV